MERLVLVDERDREIGTEEKVAAHRTGRLHRAFSILVVNRSGELLLQRRAAEKYHSGGRWSNACCGHPRPGEPLVAAAHRRLQEEMGFDCGLERLSVVRYAAALDHGLVENEVDHVLWGAWDGAPTPDPREAEGWGWFAPEALRARVAEAPGDFTIWFRLILDRPEIRALLSAPSSPPRRGEPRGPGRTS